MITRLYSVAYLVKLKLAPFVRAGCQSAKKKAADLGGGPGNNIVSVSILRRLEMESMN